MCAAGLPVPATTPRPFSVLPLQDSQTPLVGSGDSRDGIVKDNTQFVLTSAIRLTTPLFFVGLWFVGVYVAQHALSGQVWTLMGQSYLLEQENMNVLAVLRTLPLAFEVGAPLCLAASSLAAV